MCARATFPYNSYLGDSFPLVMIKESKVGEGDSMGLQTIDGVSLEMVYLKSH